MTMAASSTFSVSLESKPESFLTPDLPLHTDILAYIKNLLDPVANNISTTQHDRLREARKKRKRGEPSLSDEGVLRIKQIHTQNLAIEQIWEQARRIIDATRQEAELIISQSHNTVANDNERLDTLPGVVNAQQELIAGAVSSDEYTANQQSDAEEDDDDDEDEDEDLDSDGQITNDALLDERELGMNSDDAETDEFHESAEQPSELVQDKFGLNDGFFSIDDFNRQSEFLEQQDARGEDDGAASDEDDVDWDINPLAHLSTTTANQVEEGNDVQQDGSDEDGPTFGDPDAPSEDDDEDDVAGDDLQVGGMGNINEIMYRDFFAPPAQKKKKATKTDRVKNRSDKVEVQDDEVERTISAVHRDLFDDEDESNDDDEDDKIDPSDPMSRRSTHERKKAAIAEEIRILEAANVAKREWTLSGEAQASERPMNSLLEEDLDFERAGKPVPVITAEVTESIEELIKRRILAHDFQDIPRRRPDDLATGKDGRRGRLDFNLDDTKSKKGLAEEYEEEHLRKTDPNYVELKDEKLAKEQGEIEALWKDVCSKLDSLSSWHFRPKQPVAQLDIRVDAPTITMEDARPSLGGEVAVASQLAPQEIYKAGESSKRDEKEVAGKSGLPARREELSSDQRKRRRRREKERIRKANTNTPAQTQESKTAKDKKQLAGDLKKGGVKLIGQKGEVTDVQGNADASNHTQNVNAARLKL